MSWGDQTWEEMLVCYFDVALADQDLTLGPPRVRRREDGAAEATFHYKPTKPAKSVYLAGDFNDWKPDELAMDGPDSEGVYTKKLALSPGDYEYKFVVDGMLWRYDPGNRRQVGSYNNSLVTIPQPTKAEPKRP